MHELSIAYSVVEIATQSAVEAGAVRVRSVQVRLGALSGVVRGALEFSYEIACAGTLLEGSTLVVTRAARAGVLRGVRARGGVAEYAVLLLPGVRHAERRSAAGAGDGCRGD